MSLRKTFPTVLGAIIGLCLLSSACSSGQNAVITREEVEALLVELDDAARRRDVDAVVSRLSETAQLRVTLDFAPPITLSLNRDQYRDHTKQALSLVEAYEYKRGETVINIEPDGKTAFVADEIFETVTMRGKVIRTVTRSNATLKMENGKLVVTSSESVGGPAKTPPLSPRANFQQADDRAKALGKLNSKPD